MTEQTKADWYKIIDITLKVFPAAAAILFIFLSAKFVSRDEFLATSEKFSGRIEAIEKLLIRMESSQETDKRHDAVIADHETRIRALEHN